MSNYKQLNKFFDGYYNINDEEILNDPKVEELVQNLIKDLPKELNRKEAKQLTENERIERNEKISEIYYGIWDKFDSKDDVSRLLFKIRKKNEQIPASYEHMRGGAIRNTAWNKALKICESRYIFSKEEIKERKNIRKDFDKELEKSFKEELIK